MWLIAGTVPDEDISLYAEGMDSRVKVAGEVIILKDGRSLPVSRGTAALVATAWQACLALNVPGPGILLAGDCGTGEGSRKAYRWLEQNIEALVRDYDLEGITFHYFYPDLDSHNRFYTALEALPQKPLLVADAGFMYVAKMSGYAGSYDLFTPDIGELAFLADEKAPHPFYTRGFLSAKANQAEELLELAQKNGSCAANMIIKDETDLVVCNGQIVERISEPAVAAMECIGGTGDIVTGFATAFLAAGRPVCESAVMAARAARRLAQYCNPDPDWQVARLIAEIGPMLGCEGGCL